MVLRMLVLRGVPQGWLDDHLLQSMAIEIDDHLFRCVLAIHTGPTPSCQNIFFRFLPLTIPAAECLKILAFWPPSLTPPRAAKTSSLDPPLPLLLRLVLQILRRLQDAFVITQQRRISPDVAMTGSVSHKLERS